MHNTAFMQTLSETSCVMAGGYLKYGPRQLQERLKDHHFLSV
jgi:hypothetical protein